MFRGVQKKCWSGLDNESFTVFDTPGFGDNLVEEEKTIESLVTILRDQIQYVHVFIIAFKQTDNRLTHSLRSMISIFEKMFGHEFWENAILEVNSEDFLFAGAARRAGPDSLLILFVSEIISQPLIGRNLETSRDVVRRRTT